jgi:hypothetical protein
MKTQNVTRQATTPPRSASPRETKPPFVYLYKIDFPNDPPKRIRLPKDMARLLDIATEVLAMQRPAKQIFGSDGVLITAVNKIQPKQNIYVSAVVPNPDEHVETVYKLRLPRNSPKATQKIPPLPKPPKEKPPVPNSAEHQAIAASPYTVKENLRDAVLSLYSGLNQQHKSQLPIASTLQKMLTDTQIFCMEDALRSQFIGPSIPILNTPLGDETSHWVLEKITGMRAEDCRFVITGPPESGKSTLLSIFASLFYQKVQISNASRRYLVVPFNWSLNETYLDDPPQLYSLVITAGLNALRAVWMELAPIMNVIHQWFISLLKIPTFPPLLLSPAQRADPPSWHSALVAIGRRIHRYWNRKDTAWKTAPAAQKNRREPGMETLKSQEGSNFALFLQEIASFPLNLARAFNFETAVLVMDNFDVASYQVEPREYFPGFNHPVNFFIALWKAIQDSPFFVASRDDAALLQNLRKTGVSDYTILSTEKIIQKELPNELVIPQLDIVVNPVACRGCPGYCAMFLRVCELAQKAQKAATLKNYFARVRSVIDASRMETLRQEFMRLAVLLQAADTEQDVRKAQFDPMKMNQLAALPDYTVRVR